MLVWIPALVGLKSILCIAMYWLACYLYKLTGTPATLCAHTESSDIYSLQFSLYFIAVGLHGLYLIPWISPLLYDQSFSLVQSINYTALLSIQKWLVKYPLNCKASNWSNTFILQIFATHVATNYVHVHDFVYYLYITCMCM